MKSVLVAALATCRSCFSRTCESHLSELRGGAERPQRASSPSLRSAPVPAKV